VTPTRTERPLTLDEGRFDRQGRIAWWDQDTLRRARVLVAGAGALGNEIVKNLALLGVGNLLIADLDRIELSNLSRTVLFRESDLGRSKAGTAVEAARAIFPGVRAQPFAGDVAHDLGLGAFRWADLVVAGLDNREARLEINRACGKLGKPWIDGAIEAMDGVMRLFAPPDGPCYECTMGAADWKALEARRSCALLTRDEMQAGKVPTTATVASVIAGLQCHEAVKWLHGRSGLAGRGLIFRGLSLEFDPVSYQRKPDCFGHDAWGEPEPLGLGVADVTIGELLERARSRLGRDAVVEPNRDLLRALECPRCGTTEEVLASFGKVSEGAGRCPACRTMRIPHVVSTLDGDCGLLDRTAAGVGIPPFDILAASTPGSEARAFFLFDADAPAVLGALADGD
jgi:adenylyltransferase/sulfurtransferase